MTKCDLSYSLVSSSCVHKAAVGRVKHSGKTEEVDRHLICLTAVLASILMDEDVGEEERVDGGVA